MEDNFVSERRPCQSTLAKQPTTPLGTPSECHWWAQDESDNRHTHPMHTFRRHSCSLSFSSLLLSLLLSPPFNEGGQTGLMSSSLKCYVNPPDQERGRGGRDRETEPSCTSHQHSMENAQKRAMFFYSMIRCVIIRMEHYSLPNYLLLCPSSSCWRHSLSAGKGQRSNDPRE